MSDRTLYHCPTEPVLRARSELERSELEEAEARAAEPCVTCGQSSGQFRVLESLIAAAAGCEGLNPATCAECYFASISGGGGAPSGLTG